jgi:hypothetical protein
MSLIKYVIQNITGIDDLHSRMIEDPTHIFKVFD